MAGKIFISYRRDDSKADARDLHNRLSHKLGSSSVFMDVDNLLAGQRFDDELEKALSQCDVLVAVIGRRWLEIMREREVAQERDYVREEISEALKRRITVIPALVDRAELPVPAAMPEDVRELVMYQKQDIAHEHFGRDIDALVAAIRHSRGSAGAGGKGLSGLPVRPLAIAASVVALVVGAAIGAKQMGLFEMGQSSETNGAAITDRLLDSNGTTVETEPSRVAMRREQDSREAEAAAAAAAAKRKAEAAEEKRKAEAAAAEEKRKAEVAAAAEAVEERRRAEAAAADSANAADEAPGAPSAVQGATAEPGSTFRDCDDCPELSVVPAGTFTMGSPQDLKVPYEGEGPQHVVTIPKPFAVGKFEVTVGQYLACVDAGDCSVPEWREPGNEYNVETGDDSHYKKLGNGLAAKDNPIVGVSWKNVQDYVKWLSKKSGKSYRLLTEAEWEYAARGVTTATAEYRDYPWGHTASHERANYGNNTTNGKASGRDKWKFTAPVGQFDANAFGLHDVVGNVWEWVEDCRNNTYEGAPNDGSARTDGDCDDHVIRGGSWYVGAGELRTAVRSAVKSKLRSNNLGFRVARSLEP